MIYRVHRPHKGNGNLGHVLGYVQLCNGFVNIIHIHDSLIKAKIISDGWFTANEMMCVPGNSEVPGLYSYSIVRKSPHKTHLFYLYPVESTKKEQQLPYGFTSGGVLSWSNPTSNWTIVGGDLTGTATTGITVNQYAASYPVNNIGIDLAIHDNRVIPPAPPPAPAPFRPDNYWPDYADDEE